MHCVATRSKYPKRFIERIYASGFIAKIRMALAVPS